MENHHHVRKLLPGNGDITYSFSVKSRIETANTLLQLLVKEGSEN